MLLPGQRIWDAPVLVASVASFRRTLQCKNFKIASRTGRPFFALRRRFAGLSRIARIRSKSIAAADVRSGLPLTEISSGRSLKSKSQVVSTPRPSLLPIPVNLPPAQTQGLSKASAFEHVIETDTLLPTGSSSNFAPRAAVLGARHEMLNRSAGERIRDVFPFDRSKTSAFSRGTSFAAFRPNPDKCLR